MKPRAKPDHGSADPKLIVQRAREALERLSAEAERLRKFSELQSLKGNPVALSVDTQELLDTTKNSHLESRTFGTLDEMMILLRLMCIDSDPDRMPARPAYRPEASPVE
jgi:hypothetical protein